MIRDRKCLCTVVVATACETRDRTAACQYWTSTARPARERESGPRLSTGSALRDSRCDSALRKRNPEGQAGGTHDRPRLGGEADPSSRAPCRKAGGKSGPLLWRTPSSRHTAHFSPSPSTAHSPISAMRESEFCIPASNKAVISITPHWYDRRALDTRSNYALYSSLSHLANLCQTSPKVRDSLVCDGGLEQLVRILKQGKLCRIPEGFQLSKWQQALLCVVNVGVRGSESVRNRLIEAEIVPVIVTVLCNALEHIIVHRVASQATSRQTLREPPAAGLSHATHAAHASTRTTMLLSTQSTPRASRLEQDHTTTGHQAPSSQTGTAPSPDNQAVQRLTSVRHDSASEADTSRQVHSNQQNRRRRSISRSSSPQVTTSLHLPQFVLVPNVHIESDANDSDEALSLMDVNNTENEPLMEDYHVSSGDSVASSGDLVSMRDEISEHPHRQRIASNGQSDVSPALPRQALHLYDRDASTSPGSQDSILDSAIRAPTTWDQDVTLCLRLLAYLSKYPYLRHEFSRAHDVPRLRQNLKQFEMHYRTQTNAVYEQMDDDLSDLLRIPCNVFQLVEKFSARIHVHESTYWAGVIMRNSCRRHDQGGIRQCAYLECGVWETQNRQFAKCRRCRRTKYCSKACQSKAWTGHRYWCSSSRSTSEAV